MKRREFLGLSAVFASTAFAPNLLAKENFTVYGAPALPSIVIAVASLQGELRKKKDFSLKIWKNPDQLKAGVASGQYKVMMSPSNVGVILKNQGMDIAMLNILTHGIQSVVVKEKSGIKEIGDLVGKKIIMPFKNDMPDIILRILCKKFGVDVEKINISYVQTPPEAVSLFLTKDYDAVLAPEPMASACILKGKKLGVGVIRTFEMHKLWGKAFNSDPVIPQAGIIVDRAFYNENLEDFKLLNSDLKKAIEWVNTNKQSAAEIGANYLSAPAMALANSFEYSNLTVTSAKDEKENLMRFYEVLMQYNPKLLGGKLPSEDFFL